MDGGGEAEIFLDDFDEVAVEVPIFHAIIVAIADEEEGLVLTGIEGDAVAGFEFAFGFTGATESLYEFAVFIEFEDIVRAVTVGNEN